MKQPKSIKFNLIMNTILTVSSFLFPLVTFPYVSRVLMPAGMGKVSFATAFISYFTMLSQLGIPTYGIRACAKVRDNREELTRTAHELLCINLIMSALSYFVLAVCLITIPKLREEKLLFIVVSATILLTSIGMEWIYKALEQYGYITIRSIFFKFVAMLAVFALVHSQKDYVIYGGLCIFAVSASNICNFINVHKFIDLRPVGNYDIKKHFRPVAVFFAMACAVTIYTHLDEVMLGFMKTDVDVGYYHAAVRIKTILVGVVTSIGAVLLPRASFYVRNGQMDEFQRINRKSFHFVSLLSVPLTVYFILFAREGVLFLSGMAYEGAIVPLQVIMPTVFIIGTANISGMQILVPTGRENVVLYAEVCGAVVDVILNMLLIPTFAAAGAALGTLAAEIVVLCVEFTFLRREIMDFLQKIPYSKIAAGILCGALASMVVKAWKCNLFFTLAASAVLFFGVYAGVLLLLRETLLLEILNLIFEKLHIKKTCGIRKVTSDRVERED